MAKVSFRMASASRESVFGVQTSMARNNHRSGPPTASACRPEVDQGRLWTDADDRLPVESLGRVEGGDSIVEGRDVADVGPQSSVPHPLDDLTPLGKVGLDAEVDCQ